MNMKTRKYIGKKEYAYLTHLLKTYANIVETSNGFPLVQETFKGVGYAIANIIDMLDYDSSNHLTLTDLIMRGDQYALNYRSARSKSSAIYWEAAYDEILILIEKYFNIKLRRDI